MAASFHIPAWNHSIAGHLLAPKWPHLSLIFLVLSGNLMSYCWPVIKTLVRRYLHNNNSNCTKMVQNKKLKLPSCTLLFLILRDNPRLLFCFLLLCLFLSDIFFKYFWAETFFYCSSDIILNRLFYNLFHLTVKWETIFTHLDIVLSFSELFPPFFPWCFSFLVLPLLSDLFPSLYCYLPSSYCLAPAFCPSHFFMPCFLALTHVGLHHAAHWFWRSLLFWAPSPFPQCWFDIPQTQYVDVICQIFSFSSSIPFPFYPEEISFRLHFGVNI